MIAHYKEIIKVLEESPSSAISEEKRQMLSETTVQAAQAVHYENAGTIEFWWIQLAALFHGNEYPHPSRTSSYGNGNKD